MDKKALTLVEVLTVMVLTGILILSMCCQFVAEQRMETAIRDEVESMQDLDIAMRHVTMILRFALQGTVVIPGLNLNPPDRSTLNATIRGRANGTPLAQFTQDTAVQYQYIPTPNDPNSQGFLQYTVMPLGPNPVVTVVARHITGWAFSYAPGNTAAVPPLPPQITINGSSQKRGGSPLNITSTVQVMGDKE